MPVFGEIMPVVDPPLRSFFGEETACREPDVP